MLDPSKLKPFADDNSEFDENGRTLSKRVENTVGKEKIAHYEQFLLFPTCFQKTCTAESPLSMLYILSFFCYILLPHNSDITPLEKKAFENIVEKEKMLVIIFPNTNFNF